MRDNENISRVTFLNFHNVKNTNIYYIRRRKSIKRTDFSFPLLNHPPKLIAVSKSSESRGNTIEAILGNPFWASFDTFVKVKKKYLRRKRGETLI